MDRKKVQFENLLNKYLNKSCSLNEVKELFSYIELPEYKERLEMVMYEHYKGLDSGAEVNAVDWDEMFNAIVDDQKKAKVRSLWSIFLPIAAAIILILSVGLLFFGHQKTKDQKIVSTSVKKDIAPGGNKAVLKLADGTEIILDGYNTGVLANEDGTQISKTMDGMLQYDATENIANETFVNNENRINTLSTPTGGQYVLVLPDGTKVWLNAESSISYPSVFVGTERNVSLTGEAYFEVAKDKQHPFKVQAGAAEIKVLGTHFNIMSYVQEGQTLISLAEGSIQVDLAKGSKVLKPGQQASIKTGSSYIALKSIDIEEATNWKNGLFQFDNTPLEQVMRQIKRWYDVDVIYEGVKPDLYITGMISRSNNVSKILALIEETGGVVFEIGDKQIVVKPNKRR